MPQSRDMKNISLRSYLMIFIACAVAPLLTLAGVMTVRLSQDQRVFGYPAAGAKREIREHSIFTVTIRHSTQTDRYLRATPYPMIVFSVSIP